MFSVNSLSLNHCLKTTRSYHSNSKIHLLKQYSIVTLSATSCFFFLPFFSFSFLPTRLTGTQAIIQDARVWMFSDAQNKM